MANMGIKEAVNWLVDNEDLQELIALDYDATDYPMTIAYGFVCNCYRISPQELANKIRREIVRRGW